VRISADQITGSLPASQIGAGALPSGVTVPATQLTAGALPSGVTIPATQLTAGALPSGVTIDAGQVAGMPAADKNVGSLTCNAATEVRSLFVSTKRCRAVYIVED
jgi:hypothetical protein